MPRPEVLIFIHRLQAGIPNAGFGVCEIQYKRGATTMPPGGPGLACHVANFPEDDRNSMAFGRPLNLHNRKYSLPSLWQFTIGERRPDTEVGPGLSAEAHRPNTRVSARQEALYRLYRPTRPSHDTHLL